MSEGGRVGVIPYCPRPLQREIHNLMRRPGSRFTVLACHRRFGKTVLALNELLSRCLENGRERPRYAHVMPTYSQAKAVAWSMLRYYAGAVEGAVFNEAELRVDFPTGGQIRLYGADNPDSLRGIYLDGVVLDEFGLMRPSVWPEVIRPLLADREGWALFLGTPAGRNHFYDMLLFAERTPGWFARTYRASETGIIPEAELASARATMDEESYLREFEVSFEASVHGAIYSTELGRLREHGQVTSVPYDPALPVQTAWDLGYRDLTAVWFVQAAHGGEVRLIDYLEGEGHSLEHWAQEVKNRGYSYGTHWFPHDVQQTELGTGKTLLEVARRHLAGVQVVPNLQVLEGIHAVRQMLPRCWFDAERCRVGLERLSTYRWALNSRLNEFSRRPEHDLASHGADALRTLAVARYEPVKRVAREQRKDERELAHLVMLKREYGYTPQRRASMRRGGY